VRALWCGPAGRDIRRFQTMAYTCAVAVRDSDLFLLLSVRRGSAGDIYVNIPRDPAWSPHSSYHASGQHHHKSFGYKMDVRHRQKPDANFSGAELIVDCPVAQSEPRAINALCSSSDFDEVLEIPLDEIGENKYLTHVRIDLVAQNAALTLDSGSRIIRQHTIVEGLPHIAVTLYEAAGMRAFFASRSAGR